MQSPVLEVGEPVSLDRLHLSPTGWVNGASDRSAVYNLLYTRQDYAHVVAGALVSLNQGGLLCCIL